MSIVGATKIARDESNYNVILKQASFDIKTFQIMFTESDKEECAKEEEGLQLVFEGGVHYLVEGKTKYDVEYVYELERYVYIKEGRTLFWPDAAHTINDSKKRAFREATCYLTPVFHDSEVNDCFEKSGKYKGRPTGKCPYGTISVIQRHYYGLA